MASTAAAEQQAYREFRRSIQNMSRALRQFPDKELSDAMKKASVAASEEAVKEVIPLVPTDSGKLAANIKAKGTKTIPKIQAGTKKKGGPYAWMRHKGTTRYEGVPYMREGIKKAFGKIRRTFIDEQKKVVDKFNRSTSRKMARKAGLDV